MVGCLCSLFAVAHSPLRNRWAFLRRKLSWAGKGWPWCRDAVVEAGAWELLHTCLQWLETGPCLPLPTGGFAHSGGGGRGVERGPAVDCDQEKEVRIPQGWGEGSRQSPPPQVCPVSPVHSFSLLAVSTPLDPHRWEPSGIQEAGSRALV